MLSCPWLFLTLDCSNMCGALGVFGSSFEDSRFTFSLWWSGAAVLKREGYEYGQGLLFRRGGAMSVSHMTHQVYLDTQRLV